jgi:hypothetical protein
MRLGCRRLFTAAESFDLWRRYKDGESILGIAHALGRRDSSIHKILQRTGGIAPALRCRSARFLNLGERLSAGVHASSTRASYSASSGRCTDTFGSCAARGRKRAVRVSRSGACGWSPIGRSVRLLIEEGQPALINTQLIGTVTSLNADGSATIINSAGESFLVVPRHVGFGFYYLKVGKISAYLITDSRVGRNIFARLADYGIGTRSSALLESIEHVKRCCRDLNQRYCAEPRRYAPPGSSLLDCYGSARDCRLKVCASVADTLCERFSRVSNRPSATAILQFS